jgi:hypothetical protein
VNWPNTALAAPRETVRVTPGAAGHLLTICRLNKACGGQAPSAGEPGAQARTAAADEKDIT